MNHVKLFYEQLYTNTDSKLLDIDLEDILGKTEVPKLDLKLESEICDKEVFEVLRNMKNYKSPGSDGYTIDF